jgi:hypothetical protein
MSKLTARSELKERADANRAEVEYDCSSQGSSDKPKWFARAHWCEGAGRKFCSEQVDASTKDKAREAAARQLLDVLELLGVLAPRTVDAAAPLNPTPAGPAPAPAKVSELQLLNESVARHGLRIERADLSDGLVYTTTLTVRERSGKIVSSCEGTGKNKQAAAQDAASKLNELLSHRDPRLEDVDAWCGDKANGLLVGLLGRKAGLNAEELNNLEEEIFSNEAMYAAAAETDEARRLISARTTGTRVEADVGVALRPFEDRLIELLQAAVQPRDLARLRDALHRRTANR